MLHLSGQAARTLGDGVLTPQHAGSGYARATLAAGSGRRVTVSGPVGSAAVLTETQSPDGRTGSAELSIQTPDDKALGVDPMAKAEAYAASGRSVVVEAMAAGIPYEQAVAEFGDMDPASVPTKAGALADHGRTERLGGGRRGHTGRLGRGERFGTSRPASRVAGSGRAQHPQDGRGTDAVRLRLRRHLLQQPAVQPRVRHPLPRLRQERAVVPLPQDEGVRRL